MSNKKFSFPIITIFSQYELIANKCILPKLTKKQIQLTHCKPKVMKIIEILFYEKKILNRLIFFSTYFTNTTSEKDSHII